MIAIENVRVVLLPCILVKPFILMRNPFDLTDNLGDCYLKQLNFTLALKCFLDQLDKCEHLKQTTTPQDAISSEYDNDGYYGRRRRSIDSFRDYVEACQLATKAYHNVANTHFRMGHFDDSVIYYEKERCLLELIIPMVEKKVNYSANVMVNSEIEIQLHSLPNDNQPLNGLATSPISTSTINAISKILEDLTDKQCQCDRSIGDCHFAKGEFDEATKYYLTFLEQAKSLVAQEQVHCLLGKCYQLVNNLTQALVSYEKRLVIATAIGCNQTKALAYGDLGKFILFVIMFCN